MLVLVAQSCPTLWDPLYCSSSGSSVHGILQARILTWTAFSFSRDWTWVSCTAGRFFTVWASREAHIPIPIPIFIYMLPNAPNINISIKNITYRRKFTYCFCIRSGVFPTIIWNDMKLKTYQNPALTLKWGFSTSLLKFWMGQFFVVTVARLVPGRMFSSMLGLYSLASSSLSLAFDDCQMFSRGQKSLTQSKKWWQTWYNKKEIHGTITKISNM